MSVEFRNEGFPGWYQDDPNKPTILRANITELTNKNGGKDPIVAEFNYGDGSIQYYTVKEGIGFYGTRVPLFTQSASGARTVQNQLLLNNLKPEDIARVESSVKSTAFRANQTLATDAEKEKLKNSPYYRSQGNIIPSAPVLPSPGTPPTSGTPTADGSTSTPVVDTTPTTTSLPFSPGRAAETKIVATNIRYPVDMSDGDRISFQAHEILPRTLGLSGQVTNFAVPSRQYKPADGIVYLGIQAPINDQNTVAWQSGEINSIEAFALNASLNLMKSNDPGQGGADLMQEAFAQAGESAPQIQLYLASQAAGVSNVLSRYGNQVLNPNLELLFQGPQLRPFTFQFKMSARSKPEADAIKTIISYFKFNMAVKKSSNEVFLNSPRVFKIEYQYKADGSLHPGLNLIKMCALTACSVDYTPLASYATFGDGTMVRYDINLQFQELEPIYDINYLEPAHPIGY